MRTRLLFEIVFYSCILLWGVAKAADIQQEKASRQSGPVVVLKAQGQVEILSPSHELICWRAAVKGDRLPEDCVIATGGASAFAELQLPDRTHLSLAPNSFVQIRAADHKILLKSGGIVFSHPGGEPGPPRYHLYTASHVVIPGGTVRLSVGPHGDECIDLEKGLKQAVNMIPSNHVRPVQAFSLF